MGWLSLLVKELKGRNNLGIVSRKQTNSAGSDSVGKVFHKELSSDPQLLHNKHSQLYQPNPDAGCGGGGSRIDPWGLLASPSRGAPLAR